MIVCTNFNFFPSYFRNHLCNYAYMLIDRKWPGLLRSFRSEWAHFLLIKVKSWRETMSISCKSTEVCKFELIHAFKWISNFQKLNFWPEIVKIPNQWRDFVSGGSHQEVILNLSTLHLAKMSSLMLYLNLSLTDKKKIQYHYRKFKKIVKEIILKVLR